MKRYMIIVLLLTLYSCNKSETRIQHLEKENSSLKSEVDSLEKVIEERDKDLMRLNSDLSEAISKERKNQSN